MNAALDTNTYPTGVRIGDAEMAALPLPRHAFHGDWNHALHPQRRPAIPAPRTPHTPEPEWQQALLPDPALTGMSRQQLDDLTTTLAPDGDTQRGRPPRLSFPEQVLATVLHLRVALAAEPLAVLFDSSRTAMHRTLLKNRRLLKAHRIVIPPATTPPDALSVLKVRVHAQASTPQQQDQDDALMICKPLAGLSRVFSRSSQMGHLPATWKKTCGHPAASRSSLAPTAPQHTLVDS